MDQSLFIITIIALSMVIILMGLVLYLGYSLLKQKMAAGEKKPNGHQYDLHEGVIQRLQELEQHQKSVKSQKSSEHDHPSVPVSEQFFCTNHPQEMSSGTCIICEKAFCSHCLKTNKNLYFCTEHLQVFVSNKWAQVASVKTNPEETKPGVILYQLKHDLWVKEQIPTYMETQYKIDVDRDFIESFVALYSREKDLELIKSRLQ